MAPVQEAGIANLDLVRRAVPSLLFIKYPLGISYRPGHVVRRLEGLVLKATGTDLVFTANETDAGIIYKRHNLMICCELYVFESNEDNVHAVQLR